MNGYYSFRHGRAPLAIEQETDHWKGMQVYDVSVGDFSRDVDCLLLAEWMW